MRPARRSELASGVMRLTGKRRARACCTTFRRRACSISRPGRGAAHAVLRLSRATAAPLRSWRARGRTACGWCARTPAARRLAATSSARVFREDVFIEDVSERFVVTPEFARMRAGARARDWSRTDGPSASRCPAVRRSRFRAARLGLVPRRSTWRAGTRERIAHGWAAHGHEVSEAFTPFDVNLGQGVHLDKGCFTGQETLMRLVTYGNLRRRLVGVCGAGAMPDAPALRDAAGAGDRRAHERGARWRWLVGAGGREAGVGRRRAARRAARGPRVRDGRWPRGEVERVFAFAQPAGSVLKEG